MIVEYFSFLSGAVIVCACGCVNVCKCAFVQLCVMSCVLLYLIIRTSGDCNEKKVWSLCTSVCESTIACEGQGIIDMSC